MRHNTGAVAAAFWLMFLPALAFGQPAAAGAIDGAVKDGSGSAVLGAIVTLETAASTAQRTTVTDDAGAFHFADVAPGNYKVTIAAPGFAPWTADVAEAVGESPAPLAAVLQVAPVTATVDVLPPHELAAEQLKTEEKQRVLGVVPHYMVTYDPNAAPLSAGQKFHLGFKTLVDPVTIASTAISSGIQQAQNRYTDFGQGTEGYAKYFGAQYASHLSHVMIHHVILQAVFHQDPRYFYKDTGSFWSRVAYSFETAFVCKGDSGKWQPDYSDVIGGAAASQMSRLVVSLHVAAVPAALARRAVGIRRTVRGPFDRTIRDAQVHDAHAWADGGAGDSEGGDARIADFGGRSDPQNRARRRPGRVCAGERYPGGRHDGGQGGNRRVG
jgi:hypothetical protein